MAVFFAVFDSQYQIAAHHGTFPLIAGRLAAELMRTIQKTREELDRDERELANDKTVFATKDAEIADLKRRLAALKEEHSQCASMIVVKALQEQVRERMRTPCADVGEVCVRAFDMLGKCSTLYFCRYACVVRVWQR